MSREVKKNNEPAKGNRPLIVSYSYSGHTHRIAQEIQALTGGDWCEVHPWQPYPMAFPALLEQVKREISSGYRPRLLPGGRSPRLYPVIFVGSPIWCGTLAPPLAAWLYQNDLSGKILLPFYSHCGGVLGDFRGDIARLCPKSKVLETFGRLEEGGGSWRSLLRLWLIQNGAADAWMFPSG